MTMKKHLGQILILSALNLSLTSPCLAKGESDEIDEETISKVQAELTDSSKRQALQNEHKESKPTVDQVKELSGGSAANEDEIYKLAAEILGNFKGKSLAEVEKELLKAQAHPEAFAKKWTPEQRKKLEDLAKRLPGGQGAKP